MKRNRVNPSLLGTVLLLLGMIVPVGVASGAQATPSASPPPIPQFGAVPVGDYPEGYFTVQMAPGSEQTLTARVVAINSAPVTIRTYMANATSGVNGGMVASGPDEPLRAPATWVTITNETFDLSGNETHDASFTVRVPEGTPAGQYVTSFIAATAAPIEIPGADTFNQILRGAVAVLITVPGELHASFTVGEPSFQANQSGARAISIPLTNTGNVMIRPTGTISVTGPDGAEVIKAPIQMGAVFAGDATSISIPLSSQLGDGDYVVSGSLTDDTAKQTATIAPTTIAVTATVGVAVSPFTVDPVTIEAVGDPVQFANVAITVNNAGQAIPTAKVVLQVTKDGKPVEDYPLAQGQALPTGATQVSQRYLPATGWSKGTWGFTVVIISVSGGTETVLATVPVETTIVIP